jgi:hypothetical protein
MKRLAIFLLIGVGIAQPVAAQTTTGATGQQTANADAANTVNVVAVAQGPTGPQRNDIDYSGHTWTTPSVAGSYFGGTNPCLVGTGGGAAGGPIGFSLNLGRSDEACTRRSDAAAWHTMGLSSVAVARMCQDTNPRNPVNADAFFAATGFACPGSNNKGRYKLADGSLAPDARLPNRTKFMNASAEPFVDPSQTPGEPQLQQAIPVPTNPK